MHHYSIGERIGAFGDTILQQLWGAAPTNQNHAFSSLALYFALSASCLGASGASYEELRNVLQVNGKDDLAQLRQIINRLCSSGCLSIDNRLSVGPNIPLKPQFQADVRDCLGTEVTPGDQADIMDVTSRLVLDAQWKHQFDPKKTAPAPFQLLDGSTYSVDMMQQKKELPYGKDKNFRWVVLGHQSKLPKDDAPVLILFLPRKGVTFEQAGKLLSQARVQQAFEKAKASDDVVLKLPKIFFEKVISASELFQSTTLKQCFSHGAEFAEMSDMPVRIENIYMGVKQEWDEHGQKVEMTARVRHTTLGIHEDIFLTFDRPFYEVLYDPQTKLVLMHGRIVEPPRAGSRIPGRIPSEFEHFFGAVPPTLNAPQALASVVLENMPGIDDMAVGQFKKLRQTLVDTLKACDQKTVNQIYGFMHGPLADTLREYTERMLEVVKHLERWSRLDELRTCLHDKEFECTFPLSDLRDMLELLLAKPDYKEIRFDGTRSDLVSEVERLIEAGRARYPSTIDIIMAQLSDISLIEAQKDATYDAIQCTIPEELILQIKAYQEERDPAKLVAFFREKAVLTWIEGRTKHYTQEVRYHLARLFEPSDEIKENMKQEGIEPPNLWKSVKLAPQYFNAQLSWVGRITYEDGFLTTPNTYDFLLKPRFLSSYRGKDCSFALKEQYQLAAEPNGEKKRGIFQHIINTSLVISLPCPMQLFLRKVWTNSPAHQALVGLYDQAHKMVKGD